MRERTPTERNAHFSETINAFGSILMQASIIQESIWSVTKHAVGKLGYIDCIIYLINDDDGELYQYAAHGNKNPTAQDIHNPIKLKMGEGDKITLLIPAHLAYGDRGIPNLIPPGSDLIFNLEITEIVE